jgi:hypothetical protein
MCMNSRADTVMTDETVVALWGTLIVDELPRLDPSRMLDMCSLWIGFVTGLERYDLANRDASVRLGKPVLEAKIEAAMANKAALDVKGRFGK